MRALLRQAQAGAQQKEGSQAKMSHGRLSLLRSPAEKHRDRGDDQELRAGGELQVLPRWVPGTGPEACHGGAREEMWLPGGGVPQLRVRRQAAGQADPQPHQGGPQGLAQPGRHRALGLHADLSPQGGVSGASSEHLDHCGVESQ